MPDCPLLLHWGTVPFMRHLTMRGMLITFKTIETQSRPFCAAHCPPMLTLPPALHPPPSNYWTGRQADRLWLRAQVNNLKKNPQWKSGSSSPDRETHKHTLALFTPTWTCAPLDAINWSAWCHLQSPRHTQHFLFTNGNVSLWNLHIFVMSNLDLNICLYTCLKLRIIVQLNLKFLTVSLMCGPLKITHMYTSLKSQTSLF